MSTELDAGLGFAGKPFVGRYGAHGIAAAAALAAALGHPSGRVKCHRGAGGMAPAKGAAKRRKQRKQQKMARRKQR